MSTICDKITDGTHQSPKFEADGIPFLVISNIIRGKIEWQAVKKWISHDTYAALTARVRPERGDVLYSAVGSYGTAVAVDDDRPFAFQRHIAHIKPNSKIVDAEFLARWLNSPEARKRADAVARGVAQKTVTLGNLAEFEVPLAPLPEQRRIVEKIEALVTRSRRAREALDTLPTLIDRYRQSILAAAFRGDLTADWRAETIGTDVEGELRHLAEKRSARWPEFGRGPCRAPLAVEDPLPVPSGWAVTTLDALLVGIQSGKNFRCEERPPADDEAGVIKISAVTWGKFDQDESKTVTDRALLDPDARIAEGDFLFSRANTIELVGACVIVDEFNKELYLTDKVLRFIFASDDVKRWVLWFLRSPEGRRQIEARSSGNQMSMRNIGQDSIRRLSIPLPSKAEIAAILAVLERRLAAIESLKRMAGEQRGRLATLDQSILAKAFRGELVPQDPNDEPASVLLERIRAERAAAGPAPRRGRRPKVGGGG
ncbi:restriction endonuclease subunit S [Azospirillum oryzae]|uniref:Restriction endonuclease subunit S n=2 Tax=Azospirillum oryzae TaxID=286727 RepID=A0A6N1ALP8_9PROT|nr:restriction endonuclease subunit S [Azospirillum oryzae]